MLASWEYYSNTKQYNCKENIKRMKDESRINAFKNRNGCDARISKIPRQTHENILFYDCYCNHLSNSFDTAIFLHEKYDKGFLPFQGSILDQPNKAMELISIIEKFKYERELKVQKEIEKSNKQKR